MRAPVVDWAGQTLFGKWRVEELIGVGGTSTVLRARHRNGRRAALKVLHQHLAAHARTRERFLREGRLANLVDHPGVVAVLDDFVTEDGTAVLVLELVSGENLASRAKSMGGSLAPREVVEAACSVLEVLAVAHDAGVIHRDVKPENVLRGSSGGYKLADFGLAGLGHELGELTGTGVALGTPAYMSPEQARADTRDVDARTDLWALGASMFTLLTGRFLHSASAPKNLIVAAATEVVPPVRTLEPGIPAELAEVIDRAVRMDKEERWPNARAMLAALSALELPAADLPLRSAAVEAGTPTAPSSLTSWSRPRAWLGRADRRSSRLGRGVAAALVSLAAVVALFAGGWLRSHAAGTQAADGTDGEARLGPTVSRETNAAAAARREPSENEASAESASRDAGATSREAPLAAPAEATARPRGPAAQRKTPTPSASAGAPPAVAVPAASVEPPVTPAPAASASAAPQRKSFYRH